MFKILKYYLTGLIIGILIFSGGNLIIKHTLAIKIAIEGLQSQITSIQEENNNLLNNDIELKKRYLTYSNKILHSLLDSFKKTDSQLLLKSSVFVRDYTSSGAGTVIKKTENKMYILTCYHVVNNVIFLNEIGLALKVTVGYSKTDKYNYIAGLMIYGAKVIKFDKNRDLALLEVNIVDKELEARPIAKNEPEKGDTIYSVGNPLGTLRTISKGILANKEKGFYLTDNTITFGNSGGGLFNNKGELIGVPSKVMAYVFENKDGTELISPESGLGLSIDLKTIKEFLKGVIYD